MKFINYSAYQGRGWKPRLQDMKSELRNQKDLWRSTQVNSEWAKLETVALYRPGPELKQIRHPRAVQHLRPLNYAQLQSEFKSLVRVYKRLGIKVLEICSDQLPPEIGPVPPNLLFARDLFWSTPEGCVIARMASRVRAGEEKFAAAALAGQGILLRTTIAGAGLFEGADALWLTPHKVICGVGHRTNREGFQQLKNLLKTQEVDCIDVPMPKGVQHLLGVVQFPGPGLAVIRRDKASSHLLSLLKKNKFDTLELPESEEITVHQAMNFVTVAPRRLVMAKNCPQTQNQLERAGLKIEATVSIEQYAHAAGGLACATGIVSRKFVR